MSTKAPNPVDKHVGSRVRMRRLMLAMSQQQLGGELGITFQQVQKYEKGTNRVGAGRLPQIAEILGVPVAALFKDNAGTVPVTLVTDTAAVKILTAYAQITDPSVRRNLSGLVERIARSAEKKSRR